MKMLKSITIEGTDYAKRFARAIANNRQFKNYNQDYTVRWSLLDTPEKDRLTTVDNIVLNESASSFTNDYDTYVKEKIIKTVITPFIEQDKIS